MTRTRLYRDGVVILEDFPVADTAVYLGEENSVDWIDLSAPTPEDFATIGAQVGLHQLAVEDALHEAQRPKLDRYTGHLFISAYSVDFDLKGSGLQTRELGVFITRSALITVHKDPGLDMGGVLARWDGSPDLAKEGVGFLLYGLLDELVDSHFAAVQALDEAIEAIEELLFEERRQQIQTVQRRSFELRKDLVLLRRVTLPMREVVNTLIRQDLGVVSEPMMPFYQDIYDHVLRATEWTESLRDLITTMVETNLTVQANRMNLIMKKVTSWAAIIAVPTAITGFYGQNLPYPGFGKESGFLFSSALILALSSLLYAVFKWKDWL
jgi:magnesium transporter